MKKLTLIIAVVFYGSLYCQNPYSIDSSFRCVLTNNMNNYLGAFTDCIIEDNGKIVICGGFGDLYNIASYPFHFARLNPDGSIDTTFHYQNPIPVGELDASGVSRLYKFDGKYYACHANYVGVARYFENGARDTTFRFDFSVYQTMFFGIYSIFIDSLGRVTLCGIMKRKNGEDDRIIRLNPDGSYDSTFHKTTCFYAFYKMIHLSDGKFLVGGWDSDPTVIRSALWRIFPDGEIDTSFNTFSTWGAAGDFIELPDHKILAAGQFKIPGISDTISFCRFNENGELDTTFHWSERHEYIGTVGLNYNKILVSGYFDLTDTNHSIRYNHFAILNLDGTIDTTLIDKTFGPDSSTFYYPPNINFFRTIQGGKIYLGGFFRSFAGYNSFDLVRLYDITNSNAEIEKKTLTLLIYPNPASETVKIHYEIPCEGYLELRDFLGRLKDKCKLTRSSLDHKFNLESYPTGLYFIRLIDRDYKQLDARKLMIIK